MSDRNWTRWTIKRDRADILEMLADISARWTEVDKGSTMSRLGWTGDTNSVRYFDGEREITEGEYYRRIDHLAASGERAARELARIDRAEELLKRRRDIAPDRVSDVNVDDISFWVRPDGAVFVVEYAGHYAKIDAMGLDLDDVLASWVHVSGGRIDVPMRAMTRAQKDVLYDVWVYVRDGGSYSAMDYSEQVREMVDADLL